MPGVSPEGLPYFIPENLVDERAKNDFANFRQADLGDPRRDMPGSDPG
jgi:hypothetical protein